MKVWSKKKQAGMSVTGLILTLMVGFFIAVLALPG